MMKRLAAQFNVNTLLLGIVLTLLKWEASQIYRRFDSLEASNFDLAQRVARLEGAAGLTLPLPKQPPVKP